MLIKVRVFPNSKKKEIIKKSGDSFDIKVKARPMMGEASKEAGQALAFYFKIPESKVKLIKGFKQRNKIFEVK